MEWPSHGRVTLKPFDEELTASEWQALYQCFRDPEIAEWNGARPIKLPIWLFRRIVMADVKRGDRISFGILEEHDEWIGSIELYELHNQSATLGIAIGKKEVWSHGYGTEALKALLKYCFEELKLERVQLRTFPHNLRAQRAFSKAGFHKVREETSPGGIVDLIMEIGATEWRTANAPPTLRYDP